MTTNGFANPSPRCGSHAARRTTTTITLAWALAMAAMPVLSAEAGVLGRDRDAARAKEPAATWGTTGWPALAGLGLAAVVVGAASARRPREHPSKSATPALPADRLPMLTVAPEPLPVGAAAQSVRIAEAPEETAPETGVASRTYLALHHVDLAIETLRRHVDDDARSMPVAWLMLLDLYRTHGREEAFRDLAGRFHSRFNAQAPEWDAYPPTATEPGLEAFPRLIKEITLCWGTHECSRLLDRLLFDNRSGQRVGFSLNAYNDLVALRALSDTVVTTIEADFAEEAAVRSAFHAATARLGTSEERETSRVSGAQSPARTGTGAWLSELESQLEDDLRRGADSRSPLEAEHPALAGMLAREWGNSALAERLCEILALGADAAHPLSREAAADLATLKLIAGDLAGTFGADR
jgi:hypothetical protein